ncbi:MAG TPA: IPTL-CTERM sorting domain-containing protein [Casimicrobiaceae bacterium]
MSLAFRVLAAVLFGCAVAAPVEAARIGILSNRFAAETAADFNARFTRHSFTGLDVSSSVPPLATLLADYDVILLFEDNVFVNSTAVGDRVAQFANAGHAVVLGTFYDQDRSDAIGGTTVPHGWGALETIDPNTTDGVGTAYAVRTLDPASIVRHPLTSGVTSLAALRGSPGPYAGGNEAKAGTHVVAAWVQANARGAVDPAIAYRRTGSACVIHIGIAPDYGVLPTFGTYGMDFGGDFYPAWRNAFDYGAIGCRAAPVPALSPWAFATLALSLLAFAAITMRRRSR